MRVVGMRGEMRGAVRLCNIGPRDGSSGFDGVCYKDNKKDSTKERPHLVERRSGATG